MGMMIVMSTVDVLVRATPMRIHSPAWRLGAVGSGANVVGTPLLALFITLAIALLAEDRVVAYLVGAVSALFAVLCLAAVGIFALDALQMQGQVQPSLAQQYGLASVWLGIRLTIAILIFLVLALSAFRAARSVRRETARRGAAPAAGSLVVGTQRPSTPTTTPTPTTKRARSEN